MFIFVEISETIAPGMLFNHIKEKYDERLP